MSTQFVTSVGRLIWCNKGGLGVPFDKDKAGKPLVDKNGNSKQKFDFGMAIPKGATTHFSQLVADLANGQRSEFGRTIWEEGHRGFTNGETQRPRFAWKIHDGDSTEMDDNGVRWCDKPNHPGNWVLTFSSMFPINCVDASGKNQIDPATIKRGYYIQVLGSVEANGDSQKPGVYLNHNAVALAGYGPEIVSTQDTSNVGFGGSALPAGASQTPVGGLSAAPAPAVIQPPVVAPIAQTALPVAQVPVTPRPGFLAPPPPTAAVPPLPKAAPVLTPKANGASYAQMVAAGWTDALLREHGMIAA